MVLVSIILTFNDNIDKLLIGYFLTRGTWIYYLPQRITGLFLIISVAVSNVLFPKYSEMFSTNSLEKISRLANTAERYLF